MSIQTIKATIQMRKGAEQNFDPSQMTAGEWAVSTDSKKVWMCFSPGIVRRMATYEAFEQDMLDIQTILATCRDIQAAVERFEQLAEQHASQAETWSITSKSWAIGGTGTREGEDTDNSKYYSEQSKSEANRAKNEADRAAAIAGIDIDSELSETSANPVQNKVIAKVLAKLKEVAFSGSYTDLSNKPTIIWKANTKINEGYVTKGEGNGNKIWGTDADGNPGWKENKFVSLSNNFLVTEAGISALDAAVGPIIQKNFDNTENEIAQINGKLVNYLTFKDVNTVSHLINGLNWIDFAIPQVNGYVPKLFLYVGNGTNAAITNYARNAIILASTATKASIPIYNNQNELSSVSFHGVIIYIKEL